MRSKGKGRRTDGKCNSDRPNAHNLPYALQGDLDTHPFYSQVRRNDSMSSHMPLSLLGNIPVFRRGSDRPQP
ncbi:hypothetical protein HZ326_22660 [Fusarium oxysporum f. sp. albedinis]|nr:hypothetical protein HZ326_22660 [Fusarium oxysporum f. sp. albedinis]